MYKKIIAIQEKSRNYAELRDKIEKAAARLYNLKNYLDKGEVRAPLLTHLFQDPVWFISRYNWLVENNVNNDVRKDMELLLDVLQEFIDNVRPEKNTVLLWHDAQEGWFLKRDINPFNAAERHKDSFESGKEKGCRNDLISVFDAIGKKVKFVKGSKAGEHNELGSCITKVKPMKQYMDYLKSYLQGRYPELPREKYSFSSYANWLMNCLTDKQLEKIFADPIFNSASDPSAPPQTEKKVEQIQTDEASGDWMDFLDKDGNVIPEDNAPAPKPKDDKGGQTKIF